MKKKKGKHSVLSTVCKFVIISGGVIMKLLTVVHDGAEEGSCSKCCKAVKQSVTD